MLYTWILYSSKVKGIYFHINLFSRLKIAGLIVFNQNKMFKYLKSMLYASHMLSVDLHSSYGETTKHFASCILVYVLFYCIGTAFCVHTVKLSVAMEVFMSINHQCLYYKLMNNYSITCVNQPWNMPLCAGMSVVGSPTYRPYTYPAGV